MQRVLFIDRMDPQNADQVAKIWATHDATGLPQKIGVARRTLYRFHGLYVHMVEAVDDIEGDLVDRIFDARNVPSFIETGDALAGFLEPYSPDFRNLKDTAAEEFYQWHA
ncbi:hypothetical protein HNR23_004302 [Nocardiopsis mwathae]|uniref:Cyclase n=1 Tax=Nocardiopsis mwathae TaxID=1472723 RepID=A0A7X0D748_9ACTN|nr:TcmI family type II polyketide cyclase [Nocardiopsis mwathae]MBB6174242.1 hypothetical protein [Nocardiopsis mwathae]